MLKCESAFKFALLVKTRASCHCFPSSRAQTAPIDFDALRRQGWSPTNSQGSPFKGFAHGGPRYRLYVMARDCRIDFKDVLGAASVRSVLAPH